MGKLKEIPSFPLTGQRVIRMLAQPDFDIKGIANIVKTDQAYASRILALVNSPIYGLIRSISDTHEAIAYLGINETQKIIYALSAKNLFNRHQTYTTWAHALFTACYTEIIAKSTRMFRDSDAFICGLFHDVGKLFLQENTNYQYQMVYERSLSQGITLAQSERDIFGIDHASAGAQLTREWKLLPSISDAIENSHNTQEFETPLTAILVLANCMAHLSENQNDHRYFIPNQLLQRLNLTTADLFGIERQAQTYFNNFIAYS